MKITKDFRGMAPEELRSKTAELKKELLKLNVEVASGANTSSPGKIKQVKKNVARILTILNEKSKEDK
jgi:large subunit ribosomal protein L29